MKDFLLLVSHSRRAADLTVDQPARETAVEEAAPRSRVTTERAETGGLTALRCLQVVALLSLPLSLYLVYTYGEQLAYRGLLAAAILGNLLVLARTDAANHRQIQKELQSLRTNNPINHG